jgi:hypothetical protein
MDIDIAIKSALFIAIVAIIFFGARFIIHDTRKTAERIFLCQTNGYANSIYLSGEYFCYRLNGTKGDLILVSELESVSIEND